MERPRVTIRLPKSGERRYRPNSFSFLEFSDLELFPPARGDTWYLSASSSEDLSAPPAVQHARAKSLPHPLRPGGIMGHDFQPSDSDMPLGALNDDAEKPPDEEDYMSGFKLWLMLASLIFSIFLIALDMVLFHLRLPETISPWLTTTATDHRRDLHPRHHQRIQRPRRSSLVQRNLPHDIRRFPIHMGQDVPILSSKDQLPQRNGRF